MGESRKKYRLVPDMVPKPLFKRNIRTAIGKSRWTKQIRANVIAEQGKICQYCGASYEKGMICHEVWDYSETDRIAVISDFRIICQDCNFATHLGKAEMLGKREYAISHIAKVNGISEQEAEQVALKAILLWFKRSEISEWSLSISSELKQKYPILSTIGSL